MLDLSGLNNSQINKIRRALFQSFCGVHPDGLVGHDYEKCIQLRFFVKHRHTINETQTRIITDSLEAVYENTSHFQEWRNYVFERQGTRIFAGIGS